MEPRGREGPNRISPCPPKNRRRRHHRGSTPRRVRRQVRLDSANLGLSVRNLLPVDQTNRTPRRQGEGRRRRFSSASRVCGSYAPRRRRAGRRLRHRLGRGDDPCTHVAPAPHASRSAVQQSSTSRMRKHPQQEQLQIILTLDASRRRLMTSTEYRRGPQHQQQIYDAIESLQKYRQTTIQSNEQAKE